MTMVPVVTPVKPTGLGFWTADWLLCNRHTRNLTLQPFTSFDREQGFGKRGCPYCKDGKLVTHARAMDALVSQEEQADDRL
jgi:hypothetical protein